MAWWIPARSRPEIGRSRATVAPDREHHGVVAGAAPRRRRPGRHRLGTRPETPAHELRALRLHLVQPPVEEALLHLELGDAVAQQAARLVVALVDGHRVAGPGELLGRGQPGRAGPDDRHPPPGLRLEGGTGCHPALVPGPVDDRHLDLLDRHRVGVDAEHARRLARRRAQPPGELGEVVGGVQALDGGLPLVPVDEVVPVGDEVAERAAVVAERDAAVHAPAGLGAAAGRSGTARTPPASPAAGPARAGAAAAPGRPRGTRSAYPWAAAMMASSAGTPAASAARMASSTRL